MVLSMVRNFFRGPSEPNLSIYPIKGNCQFPNIMEQLANGSVETVTLETNSYFSQAWRIGINLSEIDGQMQLNPFIIYESEQLPKCRMGYYLRYRNSDHCAKIVVLPSEGHDYGLGLKFLDLEPELLDDGALIVEYGIRVETLQDADKIWNFQLRSDLFDSKGKQVMIQLWKDEELRCHEQIKAIHLNNSIEIKKAQVDFNRPLQIAHGVRCQPCESNWENELYYAAHDAHAMGFRNVIHYCQWQMIQRIPRTEMYLIGHLMWISLKYDMRSYLVHLIRKLNSKDELIGILKKEDIDKMSGESMKTFMKFLLYD